MGGKVWYWRLVYNSLNYSIFGLLLNGMLFCLYMVMVFTEHPQCKNENGKGNVTAKFMILFQLGFGLTLIDIILTCVCEARLRSRSYKEREVYGKELHKTSQLQTAYLVATWILRFVWVIVTLIQVAILALKSS